MSTPAAPLYFGKLPSRGDFVRSAHSPALVHTLDHWLTGGLEAMVSDPRWKEVYDQAGAAHFAVLGPRNPLGLAGHLIPSRDASGRRFPFIMAARWETDAPWRLLARCPLVLNRIWAHCARWGAAACAADDAGPVLTALGAEHIDTAPSPDAHEAGWRDFSDMQTVDALAALLQAAGHTVDLRQLLIGLGLLLQPVPASGVRALERGLLLPLPADPLYRPLVATLWLDLVAGFLARADFELVLFLPAVAAHRPPVALLGFEGASARGVHAWLDPAARRELYIDTREAAWVDEHLDTPYPLHKFSAYLGHGGLSLRQAVETFKEVFLGT